MISILLSTYNGEKFLKEQLESLINQTYKDFKIIVRDDGSTDNTKEILKKFNLEIISSSENLGASGSFSALLEYAVNNTDSNYFMFCDQDDVWEKDKIELTMKKMNEIENKDSVLIHSDLRVVNSELEIIEESFMSYQGLDPKYAKLNNLLMQNNITGCTVMINRGLAEISLPIPKESIMHDWWIGLVASKFGKIAYIDKSTINYRQHLSNVEGAKKFDLSHILKKALKKNQLTKNINQAKAYLEKYKNQLDNKDIEMLEHLSNIEDKSFFKKVKILRKYKLLKQGFIRNIGLFIKI